MNGKINFLFLLILLTMVSGLILFFSTMAKTTSIYAHNMILIKFKEDSPLNTTAQEMFEQNKLFSTIIQDPYLDQLNEGYGVIEISRIFKDKRTIDEIKEKFPLRSERAPKNYHLPRMQNIYIFKFEKEWLDISKICQAYKQSPHVEYARPNYYAKINPQ